MNLNYLKSKTSLIFLLFIICFISLKNLNEHVWRDTKIIDYDITSYYAYLPAHFIKKDIKLKFTDSTDYYIGAHQYWPLKAPNGGKVIKTTMGLAFMYAPFFAIANIEAKIFNQKQDGFSYPYHKWIHFSGFFYFIIGLIFLRKLLLKFFDDLTTGLSLFVIALCTNILYYGTVMTAMPHVFDFCLLSIFLYYSIKWFENKTYKNTLVLAVIGGLLLLIRPTNILFFLFPILIYVNSFKDLNEKFKLLISEWRKISLLIIVVFLIILPQLIYWKYITGSFIFNSYIGEHFFWNKPHVLEGLFSYRKGWLVYTPIMIFSIFGFIFLYKKFKYLFWSVFLFFCINIYILFCWWSWWYGGGYGMRSLIDCYPLLAIPLAAFINFIVSKKNKLFLISLFVIIFFSFRLNLIQINYYRLGVLHWDGMTKVSFWKSFAGHDIDSTYWESIKPPDYEKAIKGEDEYDFKPF